MGGYMKSYLLLFLVMYAAGSAAWGCSSGGDGGKGGDTADAALAEADGAGGGDGAGQDGAQAEAKEDSTGPVVYPEPADPLPELEPGTYGWTDGKNSITFAVNDGKVFLLAASFSCVGETGCKVINEFTKLTCNKAFEKGYVVDLKDGVFMMEGVKGSDKLYGAVQAADRVALVYELAPVVSCCKADFSFDAAWGLKEDCSDYANPDCDPFTDEFCEDGFNCIFGLADKPGCVLEGDAEAGAECATQGNCKDGVCMAFQTDDKQHCYKYCKTMADCGMGKQCLGIEGAPYKVCSLSTTDYEKCNLLTQNCKEEGEACYWSSSTINQPICLKVGAGEKGDECSFSNDCGPGLDCIAGKECMQICNTNDGLEPQCESPFTPCPPYFDPQDAGYCDE